ncbi:MAG TPA: phosphotransferase, partial [Burkholderiaceae bacterium]|nr:phosphotransferase [Burkholderiaceae bacterium]
TEPLVADHIPPALRQLLHHEVREQLAYASTPTFTALPHGPVHADLFRNNVLFDGTEQAPRLGGFIDFYFGGVDTWLFDLAVTVNDWCIDLATGELDETRALALTRAYHDVRAFSNEERAAWTMALRAAALRFWISRLYDYYLPREAETLTPHDPAHFERVLRLRRLHDHALP